MTNNNNILKELDGFRVIAIFLVVSFHLSFYFNALPGYNTLIGTGYLGVQLFFLLSSFLLSRQFLMFYPNNPDKFKFVLTFFKKRIFRIYPLFIFSSIVLYVIAYKQPTLSFGSIMKYVLFIEDIQLNPVMWSLFVEMRFYLILPIIMHVVCILLIKGQVRLCYVLLFNIALISYVYRFSQLYYNGIEKGSDIVYNSFWANLDCLALGVAAAIVYQRNQNKIVNTKAMYLIIIISVCALFAAMHIKYHVLFEHLFFPYAVFSVCNILWMVTTLSLLFVKTGTLNKIFSLNIFVYLSSISYGIYIWHLPIRDYIYTWFHSYQLNGIFILFPPLSTWIITLVISMICYKYLEFPLLYKSKKDINKI